MDTTPERDVSTFLERYADALSRGDLPGIAGCYVLPALVVGDGGAISISEPSQVEAAFAGAAEAYREQGLVTPLAELQSIDPLTAALTLVEVRWAYLDEAGTARQHTSYRYLLRRTDAGGLGIQVVIDTTPSPG
jgi:ketosteroid isomerase-like protein